jgi:hypothetical protein
VRKWILQ